MEGCKSEVVKVWHKRWFVLKQGYLFRFLTPDVTGVWRRRAPGGAGGGGDGSLRVSRRVRGGGVHVCKVEVGA